ncbi:hypothetical protein [Burkholderia cenocepacia]|uniref:hypothetical protein n=1 Tax=Burkholderia cenocepacia TaxID=95486 RepID=UPI0015C3AE60|nr:hypothetical protein [Burkholderia cenocepacia]
MRKLTMLIVLAQMLFAATTGVAAADSSSRSVTTHGLTVHFGIVPAEKAPRVPEEGSAPGDTKRRFQKGPVGLLTFAVSC